MLDALGFYVWAMLTLPPPQRSSENISMYCHSLFKVPPRAWGGSYKGRLSGHELIAAIAIEFLPIVRRLLLGSNWVSLYKTNHVQTSQPSLEELRCS